MSVESEEGTVGVSAGAEVAVAEEERSCFLSSLLDWHCHTETARMAAKVTPRERRGICSDSTPNSIDVPVVLKGK